MRLVGFAFIALAIGIQFPLWLGKGGWVKVWQLREQLEAKQADNAKLAQRNAAMAAEVRDLKHGLEAIEERARAELGMIKKNEVFIQVVPQRSPMTVDRLPTPGR